MQPIDFLPAQYRERYRTRQIRGWRWLMLLGMVAAVGAISLAQGTVYRGLKKAVEDAESRAAQDLAEQMSLTSLEAAVDEQRQFAQLYAYLRHPWPRTQVLAELLRDLPATTSLTELRLLREALTPSTTPRFAHFTDQTSLEPGPEADLKRLREEHDPRRLVVYLEGFTGDDAALHRYVGDLRRSPLVTRAAILSLEAFRDAEHSSGTRFSVRVEIQPGFGQPGGPVASLSSRGNDQRNGESGI